MKSDFGYLYLNDWLDILGPKQLPGAAHLGALPHVSIADEAFPLKPTIMCPYPRGKNAYRLAQEKQIFNLRLSRACRIVENAFGILAQRFRLYNRRLQLNVDLENVDKVVKVSCVLHNYLRDNRDINATNAILNPDRQDYLGVNGAILNLQDL